MRARARACVRVVAPPPPLGLNLPTFRVELPISHVLPMEPINHNHGNREAALNIAPGDVHKLGLVAVTVLALDETRRPERHWPSSVCVIGMTPVSKHWIAECDLERGHWVGG